MRNLMAAIAGGVFGVGLWLSGMTDTTKVMGWLDFFGDWDPTLAFVMGGAIIPMVIAWRVAARRPSPALGGVFPPLPTQRISRDLVVGSILFGIGWGLVGLCPGPAMASLSWGGWPGLVFLIAMMAGMWIMPRFRSRLDALQAAA